MNTDLPPSTRPRVLLIDDNRDVHQAMAVVLERAGFHMASAFTPEDAYSLLELERIDAIVLDLNFTRGKTHGDEGFAALARLLNDDPEAAVVVVTGHSGIRIAVAAMRAGALDFVMKPWRNEDLLARVQAAVSHRHRTQEIARLRAMGDPPTDTPRLLGSSVEIEYLRDLVRRVGPTIAPVLITGPAGSGRTLLARQIHLTSSRADDSPIVLEASAAVDAADREAAEALARSAHTSLILRHVDQLADTEQARLLARLPTATRVIATAHSAQPLTAALRARVGTVELAIPALHKRGGDAALLALHFARAAEVRHGRPVGGFTPDAEAAISSTVWNDDVRGLLQAIERAVVLSDGGPITAADLIPATPRPPSPDTAASPSALSLEASERTLVEAALKHHGFNVSKAAQDLGLSRAALYRRMAKYGL